MAAALLVTPVLSGCNRAPPNTEPQGVSSTPPVQHKPPPAVARPPVARPPAVAPNNVPVPDLVGMSRSQVEAVLGQPDARGPSGSSENWTYRSGACSVRLDFFLDISRNDYYALSRSVSGAKDDKDEQRCLQRIASRAKSS